VDGARATGLVLIQNFESRLQGDILAVEAAIAEPWSNGPVELLRARLMPLPLSKYL
jgi:transposase